MRRAKVSDSYKPAPLVIGWNVLVADIAEEAGADGQSIASCFAGAGRSTNISGASSAACMRRQAISK